MRTLLATLIAVMPFNWLRCLLYKLFFRYTISNSHIGWLAVINVQSLKLDKSKIGKFTIFTGPMAVFVHQGVQIGFRNRFNCGKWVESKKDYSREIIFETGVLVTNGHHFDVAGRIRIGKQSVVAGLGSQFWTHGNGVVNKDINIGENCYIGTSSIFCPGAMVANKTVVGAGTVITRQFEDENVLIVGANGQVKTKND